MQQRIRVNITRPLIFTHFSCHLKIFQFVHLPKTQSARPHQFHCVLFWTDRLSSCRYCPTLQITRLANKVRTVQKVLWESYSGELIFQFFANFFTFLGFFPDLPPMLEWKRSAIFCKFILTMLLTCSNVFLNFLPPSEINLSIVSTCQNDCLRSDPLHLRSISLHCSL